MPPFTAVGCTDASPPEMNPQAPRIQPMREPPMPEPILAPKELAELLMPTMRCWNFHSLYSTELLTSAPERHMIGIVAKVERLPPMMQETRLYGVKTR